MSGKEPPADSTGQTGGRHVTAAVDHALNGESALPSSEEADRLHLLLRITNALVSKLNLPELLRTVSTIMREIVRQEYVCLLVYDESHRQVRLLALDSPDYPGQLSDGYVVDVADSPGERALQTKRPVVIQRLDELRQFGHDVIRMLVSQGFQSVCSLPLLSGERAIGCLNLASRREQAFPESDIDFSRKWPGRLPWRWKTPWPIGRSRNSKTNWPRKSSISKRSCVPSRDSRTSSATARP
jgi:formate hydrogenlyase transcriptional activator